MPRAHQVPTETEIQKTNPPMVPLFGVPAAQWVRSPNGLPEGESCQRLPRPASRRFRRRQGHRALTLARITLARGTLPGPHT